MISFIFHGIVAVKNMRFLMILLSAIAMALASSPVYAKKNNANSTAVIAAADSLTLEDVITGALIYSPQLHGLREGISAERGTSLQMSRRPNPVLSLEAENVLGTRNNSGTRSAELTASIQQTFETGGKRAARSGVGSRQVAVATVGYRAGSLDVVRDVTASWADLISASEKVSIAEKQKALSKEMLKNVTTRVDAAAEPAIQRSKAEIAYNNSIIQLEKANRNVKAAKQALSKISGLPIEVKLDKNSFYKLTPAPDEVRLDRNPDIALQNSQVELANASLKLEKANAFQDVTFGVGVRDSRDSNSQSFVGGVSIPFPLFNSNEGAIARSTHEKSKAEQEVRQKKIDVETNLSNALASMDSAFIEATGLKRDILPAAEKAFSQARQGYKAGKYPYLDVLDAQRTLAEVREQYIDVIKNYQVSKAVVDRITGRYADFIVDEGKKK